jgi:hypothetical protein
MFQHILRSTPSRAEPDHYKHLKNFNKKYNDAFAEAWQNCVHGPTFIRAGKSSMTIQRWRIILEPEFVHHDIFETAIMKIKMGRN